MLLAVANTKGGQGKTTLACTLAAHLGAELLDANPENGDADAWARLAGHPCQLVYRDTLQMLEGCASKKSWSVVDCPPWDGDETRMALAHAKAVVVPVAAGYQDLRGLARMASLIVEAREKANPRLRAAIIGTMRRSTSFAATWADALQGYHRPKEGLFYLGSLPQRQAVVDAFGAGLPAYQAGQPAGKEVSELLTKLVVWLETK